MSRSRDKGTAWETAVLKYVQRVWPDAYRTGSADYGPGDVVIPSINVAIECKSVAKIELSEIMKQCAGILERNDDLSCVIACIKKRGSTSPADAYWVTTGWPMLGLLCWGPA